MTRQEHIAEAERQLASAITSIESKRRSARDRPGARPGTHPRPAGCRARRAGTRGASVTGRQDGLSAMRPPGYECLDRNGANRPYESMSRGTNGREELQRRRIAQAIDAELDAEAPGDAELRRMRLRMLELEQAR